MVTFVVMAADRTRVPTRKWQITALVARRAGAIMTVMTFAFWVMTIWRMAAKFSTFRWLGNFFTSTGYCKNCRTTETLHIHLEGTWVTWSSVTL